MTDGFTADPERLAAQAAGFADLAGRVEEIHRTLSESLTDCWGSDAVGQSFAASHVRPAAATLAGLAGLNGRLTDVGTRFTGTATTYTATDESAGSRLPDV